MAVKEFDLDEDREAADGRESLRRAGQVTAGGALWDAPRPEWARRLVVAHAHLFPVGAKALELHDV